MDDIPASITDRYEDATLRKVYIQHDPHSFRLIFVHWIFPDADDHVDVIYAFPRKKGYSIDWAWVAEFMSR